MVLQYIIRITVIHPIYKAGNDNLHPEISPIRSKWWHSKLILFSLSFTSNEKRRLDDGKTNNKNLAVTTSVTEFLWLSSSISPWIMPLAEGIKGSPKAKEQQIRVWNWAKISIDSWVQLTSRLPWPDVPEWEHNFFRVWTYSILRLKWSDFSTKTFDKIP